MPARPVAIDLTEPASPELHAGLEPDSEAEPSPEAKPEAEPEAEPAEAVEPPAQDVSAADEPDDAATTLAMDRLVAARVGVHPLVMMRDRGVDCLRATRLVVRRHRHVSGWVLACVAGAAVLLVLSAATLARSTPRWWGPIDFGDPSLAVLAQNVENGAITHITADHQGATSASVEWPVKLSDDGANAWLNLRLRAWLPKLTAGEFEPVYDAATGEYLGEVPIDGVEWPEGVREIRLAFRDGRFRIGALVEADGRDRVFSATLAPEVRADGSLWMRATRVGIGRLSLPAWMVLGDDGGWLRGSMPADLLATVEAEAVFEKLAGQAPLFEDAVIKLGDGRRVRLLTLRVGSESLVARFRTEWADEPGE
ncbi:MAG: hypothetical protein AAGF47_08005 [Planctomycetota bacterium]